MQKITIEVAKTAKEFLTERGFDENFGARPLRRAIQKYLEDPLSEEILKGNIKFNSKVKVKLKKGSDEFTFVDVTKDTSPDKDSKEETFEESKEDKGL